MDRGGLDDGGVVFRVVGGEYEVVKHFERDFKSIDAFSGELLRATDGLLYGLTTCRAHVGSAVMITFSPADSALQELGVMPPEMGEHPTGHLVEVAPGVFLGVCRAGGAHQAGTIFRFTTADGSFTKLYDMETATGSKLDGGLALHPNGLLYGGTRSGGENGSGVLYSFDLTTHELAVVHHFPEQGQAYHISALTVAADQHLFGLRSFLSPSGGTLFRFDPQTQGLTVCHAFTGAQSRPVHGLTAGPVDALYGGMSRIASADRGEIFRFDPITLAYSVVHQLQLPAYGPPTCTPVFIDPEHLALHTGGNGLSPPWSEFGRYMVISPTSGEVFHSQNAPPYISRSHPAAMVNCIISGGVTWCP
ncbi:MAG: hypothetical protein RBT71_12895, partial [Flavobacteriales bacterium]|nr:hypothetical protein [Flavobacteriales bacterium]